MNLRGAAHQARRFLLDEGEATFLVSVSGSFWPSSSLSLGLGSKRSIWLGPPSRKMQMQRLAFGGEVRRFGPERIERCVVGFAADIRIRGQQPIVPKHRRQRQETNAAGGGGEKVAAG